MPILKARYAIALVVLLSACAHPLKPPSPGSNAAIMAALDDALTYQYHACVPLGWSPVAVAGTYYPGYTAALSSYGEFFDAIWRGQIGVSETSNRQIKPVYEVLNHLVSAGLLTRKRDGSVYDYYLSDNALEYYYGGSHYDNNRGDMRYLCYSRLVPSRLLWVQRVRRPSDWRGRAQWYRVSFTWKPSVPAKWAADPFLRRHSTFLSPLRSPVVALMYFAHNDWHVGNLYDRTWMMPVVSDARAWNSQRE